MLNRFADARLPADSSGFMHYQRARKGSLWSPSDDIDWSDADRMRPEWREWAWLLTSSSFYAEQTGMLVAAGLLSDVDDLTARLCLATAVSDEAKHVEVFARAAEFLGGQIGDVKPAVENAYEELAELDDWMGRYIVHTMLESFAMEEFSLFMLALRGNFVRSVYENVRRDEIRHVVMGLDYLALRLPDPAFEEVRADIPRLERFAFRVGGIDDDWYRRLARFAKMTPEDFRARFLQRHRTRFNRAVSGQAPGVNLETWEHG